MANFKSTRNTIPTEEREKLKAEAFERWTQGQTFNAIAKEMKTHWVTIEKYVKEALRDSNAKVDVVAIAEQWRETTYRIAQREVRQYYLGKVSSRDANDAIDRSNKYNGVDKYLAAVEPDKAPNLLTIEVKHVAVEKPPEVTVTTPEG